jgi:hypothetical protein
MVIDWNFSAAINFNRHEMVRDGQVLGKLPVTVPP